MFLVVPNVCLFPKLRLSLSLFDQATLWPPLCSHIIWSRLRKSARLAKFRIADLDNGVATAMGSEVVLVDSERVGDSATSERA